MGLLAIVLVVAVVIYAVITVRERKIKEKVMANSQRIKDLLALNQEMAFHDISNCFDVCKHYDNKTNYNKIEPAYLMTGELRSDVAYYLEYANHVKENRDKLLVYKEKTSELLQRKKRYSF